MRVNRNTYGHADDLSIYYKFEDTLTTFPTETNVVGSGTLDGTYVDLSLSDLTDRTPSTDATTLSFDSVGFFTATGTNLPLPEDSADSFTAMTWINSTSTATQRFMLGMHHTGDTLGTIPRLRLGHEVLTGDLRLVMAMNTPADESTTIFDPNIVVNTSGTTWYQVTSTYDSVHDAMLLYTNGMLVASGTVSGTSKRINEFTIGTARLGATLGPDWLGFMDTVAVWDTVLTADQVSAVYNNGNEVDLREAGATGNLQAWYRLGEAGDSQDVIRDHSGNNRDLVPAVSGHDISDETPFN